MPIRSWVQGGVLAVPPDTPQIVNVWGLGEVTEKNIPCQLMAPREWHRIDLSEHWVSPDAKAVLLSGALVCSGNAGVYCSIVVTFRGPGSERQGRDYSAAAVAPVPSGAFRQNFTLLVPVVQSAIEFWWDHSPEPGGDQCPMTINVSLQGILR